MLFEITSASQAETILRMFAEVKHRGEFMFMNLSNERIPCVLRKCSFCEKPSTYLGNNIWGKGMQMSSTYCQHCGYAMKTLACATILFSKDACVEESTIGCLAHPAD